MRLKCNKELLKYMFMVLPFFEPYSISMMSESSSFWRIVSLLFTAGRYIVSLYCIMSFLVKKKKPHSKIGVICIVFIVARILASTINGTIYATYLLSLFTYIGFVLLCEKLVRQKTPDMLFDVLVTLFGCFSLIGCITIILLPNGLNHAITKADALYFLGSKNSSFYYFFMFLTAWILKSALNEKIMTKRNTRDTVLFFSVFIFTAFLCDSSNSVGSFVVLLLFYLLVRFSHLLYKLANPKVLLSVIVIVTLLLLLRNNIPFFNVVFSALGRNGSMTGRDYIWDQQINLIRNNPIWGNGIDVVTVLQSNAIATHAHNFYLDTIVKYGAISLTVLVVLLMLGIRNISKMKRLKFKTFLGGAVFCLLLHSIFDDISLYLLFLIFMITEFESVQPKVKLRLAL